MGIGTRPRHHRTGNTPSAARGRDRVAAAGSKSQASYRHRSGPLFAAVIIADAEIVRLLLHAGAQPNEEWDWPQSLYDWAVFEYQFEEYGLDMLPEEPSEQDYKSPDRWLQLLERMAEKHGRRSPDCLRLLRDAGAKTSRELEAEGHPGSERPPWMPDFTPRPADK
jgi:hypothetical protein